MVEENMEMNSGETPNQRMLRLPVCNLNSINPELRSPTESHEDFKKLTNPSKRRT